VTEFRYIRLTHDQSGVVTLTLCRPHKHNTLNSQMAQEITAALKSVAARALILTGHGQSFCAGADLSEIGAVFDEPQKELGPELANALEDYEAPTIAAIEGHCLGGGFELAIRCDLRVAGRTARLGLPEVCRGLIPGGVIERTAVLIGVARAKELMFFGHPIDAETAASWGLVGHLAEPGSALALAQKLGTQLAAGAPLALAEIKRLLRETLTQSRAEAYAQEIAATIRLARTADAAEGIAAFLAKRIPHFTGK